MAQPHHHKTKEEWHAELQTQFINVVNKMVRNGCPLPDSVVLYHAIHERINRSEHSISIETFLTRDAAQSVTEEDNKGGGGKLWHVDRYKVIESGARYDVDRMYL